MCKAQQQSLWVIAPQGWLQRSSRLLLQPAAPLQLSAHLMLSRRHHQTRRHQAAAPSPSALTRHLARCTLVLGTDHIYEMPCLLPVNP